METQAEHVVRPRYRQVSVNIPFAVWEKVEAEAKRRDRSPSEVIRDVFEKWSEHVASSGAEAMRQASNRAA